MLLQSPQNDQVKELVRLHTKKHRDKMKMLLVEGEHLVQEAKQAGLVETVYGLNPPCDVEISEGVAAKLSQTQSGSTLFAKVRKPNYKLPNGSRYFVCDGIQDPGNVGTIIRTAHSFGFDAVILTANCADEWNDKTIRSSQGAVFHIPVLRLDDESILSFITDNSITLVATHVSEKNSELDKLGSHLPIAVVLGSEGAGVRPELLKASHQTVHIPTTNFESLNVAVAAGIIAYILRK